ncbi:efflux RND transporter periplasmic adaptor subunit [Pseudoalteromonas umbrosa]|uniref:efflux RND transporter periplasmic adaptor subunit n=1 Tax=Pseudoalteromonas umbrosa TaxID=3048489 RepID=UPI0024C38AB7|nr:HlyD family efflux transporter periplasmic adaptor subunit [Pseudoalteromonas sp. B95]MDK1288435.1 HlyD family efflux transporter periplasmic adaptor subunit [Pseudoalteromonas sp. B95]
MKIELKEKKPWKRWVSISIFLILIVYAAYAVSSKSVKTVDTTTLNFQVVQSGPLDVYTKAYGELASAKERILTAPALGKVADILVRPGTKVSPDSVILRLSNPKLAQEVNEASGKLAELKAQREAFKYEQQSELLRYQGNIANIEASVEKAKLELSLNEELSRRGVASEIELKRAKLFLKQESKKLEFEKQKYQQFRGMQRYQLTQRDIIVDQQASQVALLQKQLDDMQVTAGISGSLQSLDIELGQSVQLGQSLAKVGSDEELIARLRLPQHQADQIDINAPVIINTQKGLINARITRVESIVTNGTVQAEAILDSELTSNARPALQVSSQVFIKHEENAVYITQASGLRPRSKQAAFVRYDDLLVQREVLFGELSDDKLIIREGLSVGDELAIFDATEYEQYQQLNLKN